MDADGIFQGSVQAIVDVTERKKAEQALRESELRLRTVVANAPVVLFATDAEGIFTLAEGKGLEVLGANPDDLVGRSIYQIYADVPEVGENAALALAGEAFSSTFEIAGIIYETYYSPVREGDTTVSGFIGVSIDVTERVRAEAEIRKLNEELEQRVEERAPPSLRRARSATSPSSGTTRTASTRWTSTAASLRPTRPPRS